MRKLLVLLFLSCAALAQNSRIDQVALGPRGPIPFATVAVCQQPANTSTQPCSPLATLCSSLSDVACIQPNPLTADSLGNYHFYVKQAQGVVTIQIYGPQVASPLILPDQAISFGSGSTATLKSLNSVQYADQFAGGDCGAKINAASAGLAGPGEIWVNQNCGTTWTTPATLTNGQVLRFIQGGTYVTSGNTSQMVAAIGTSGTHKSNIHVIGNGVGTTYLQAQASGGQLGSLVQFVFCDDCSVENLTLDANNNTTTNLVDEMDTRFLARNLRLLADTVFNAGRNYCIHVRGSVGGNYENVASFGGSQDGILIGVGPFGAPTQAAQQNRFTNITTTNSPANGLDLGGTATLIVQNNFLANIFSASNGSTGLSGGTDDRFGVNLNFASSNVFDNITTLTNNWSGIRINGGSNNVFTGVYSTGNGTAGANTGDGIRLEIGTVGNPNKNNLFQGVAQGAGTNFAVGTAGSNTSANSYTLAIGTSTVNLAAGANTDFFFLVPNNNAANVGPLTWTETSAPAGGIANQDLCYGDSTAHAVKCSYNNGSFFNTTQTIGSGTSTTNGTAINTLTCQVQPTITVTGATTSDVAQCSLNVAVPATWQTGIVLSTPSVTSNTVTYSLCNPTATATITPAATAVRCTVTR